MVTRLVTVEDFRRFILAEAPVRAVAIVSGPESYAVTITVDFKWWVIRRGRAARRLDAKLRPELPLGLKMTLWLGMAF